MKKLSSHLLRDLAIAANNRSIATDELIEQILCTAMLHEKYLTDEDNLAIIAIYQKYMGLGDGII